jgi:hypothetical protein
MRRLKQRKKTVPQILPGQAVDAALPDCSLQRAAPVIVAALGIAGEPVVRRFLIGLVTADEGRKRAIVDGLIYIVRVAEPGEHLVGQNATALLERSPVLTCFEVEMQAHGARQVASATCGGARFPVPPAGGASTKASIPRKRTWSLPSVSGITA